MASTNCQHVFYYNGCVTYCKKCYKRCDHTRDDFDVTYTCKNCNLPCSHSFSGNKCSRCGFVCVHEYEQTRHSELRKCKKCKKSCDHKFENSECTHCKYTCKYHSFSTFASPYGPTRQCTVCGAGGASDAMRIPGFVY